MSRTRTLLASTGVAALLATGLTTGLGPGAASAQDARSPREGGRSSAQVAVVHDAGVVDGPARDSAASLVTCYGGAKPWDVGTSDYDGDPRYIPGVDDAPDAVVGRTPVYVASSRCNDVNVRITTPLSAPARVRVCFLPYQGGYYCNQGTTIAPGDHRWHVPATGLVDGTRFEVEFVGGIDHAGGDIAY